VASLDVFTHWSPHDVVGAGQPPLSAPLLEPLVPPLLEPLELPLLEPLELPPPELPLLDPVGPTLGYGVSEHAGAIGIEKPAPSESTSARARGVETVMYREHTLAIAVCTRTRQAS
jgi:hypothetical protein